MDGIRTGPGTVRLTSDPSDSSGVAQGEWKTSAGRKNRPGTAAGQYTVTVKGVTASGYAWNQQTKAVRFTIR